MSGMDGLHARRAGSSSSSSPPWWLVFSKELRELWIGGKALSLILLYTVLLGLYAYLLATNTELKLMPLKEMVLEMVKASIAVVDMLTATTELRDKVEANTKRFRQGMTKAGFDIKPGDHPIVPIMLYNAKLSQDVARGMYAEGIYVIGFYYPVVAKGLARIRCQMSAGHTFAHIDKAVAAFTKIGKKYDILGKTKEQIIAKYGE